MRNKNSDKISYAEIDDDEISIKKHRHNLRPQKPNRHLHALKQQAKRRQKNKNVATGSPQPQRTMSRRSTVTSNGEIEVAFKPSADQLEGNPQTMKELLNSIPGFNLRKLQLKGQNKKFTNAQMIQQTKEGSINLDTPDSILTKVNLRTLLNKSTFTRLPPLYQFKLMQLLPQVDLLHDDSKGLRLNSTAFNNEFFAKACHEWRERLAKGDFTPEALQKNGSDLSRDKQRLDPWKLRHYEPLWGMKRSYDSNKVTLTPTEPLPDKNVRTRRSAPLSNLNQTDSFMQLENTQRKSERRKAPATPAPETTVVEIVEDVPHVDVVDAVESKPELVEESVIVVTSEETILNTEEVNMENDQIVEHILPIPSPESGDSRSCHNKSPRVTISEPSEEIQDICEPEPKKRKLDVSDVEDVGHDVIDEPLKCFNDPILELDSKYDLSPEETCPENFMESMDEGNEVDNSSNEDMKQFEESTVKFDDVSVDIKDIEQPCNNSAVAVNEDEEAADEPDLTQEEVSETLDNEGEQKEKVSLDFQEVSYEDNIVDNNEIEEEKEDGDEVGDEASLASEDDSQHAPTLSSVEPIGSVESNVLSVEMPPPTLSPNYGSPNEDDLSDENDNLEAIDNNIETDLDQDEEFEEEETSVESQPSPSLMTTPQVEVQSTEPQSFNEVTHEEEKEDVDLDDPPTPSATFVRSPNTISAFQLPTVPLSLQETRLHASSLSSSLSSPASPLEESQVSPGQQRSMSTPPLRMEIVST